MRDRQLIKGLTSAVLVLVLTALIIVGALLYALRAQRQLGAEQPAPSASTPREGASASFNPPPVVAAALRNATVHWTATSYSSQVGARDPFNGKLVASDDWAQTDANGAVVQFHAIYTDLNGAFVQEVLQDTAQTTRVFSPAYTAVFPTPSPIGTNLCQRGPGGLNAAKSSGLLPPFSEPAALSQQGFRFTQASAPSILPAPAAPSGVLPTHVYPSMATAQRYERDIPLAAGQKETQIVEIQADTRVVLTAATVADAAGGVLSQTRQAYGAVQLFVPGTVPPSAFALSPTGAEICHA
ncbi:MAG TPA: hypothetical protein VKV26_02375 [Dehalococcoidia bacterium]|nr:hypothetical protein [Dehalococcoidia bacterium]